MFRTGYQVFAIQPYDAEGVIPHQSHLPHSPADDYFISNAHLAYSGFAPASASPSTSRARTRSESGDSDEDRPARRRRIASPEKPTDMGLDEEEMLRLALKASLEDEQVIRPEDLEDEEEDRKREKEEEEPKSEDSWFEDEPSIDEMRRRRLARFGG